MTITRIVQLPDFCPTIAAEVKLFHKVECVEAVVTTSCRTGSKSPQTGCWSHH